MAFVNFKLPSGERINLTYKTFGLFVNKWEKNGVLTSNEFSIKILVLLFLENEEKCENIEH